MARPAAAQSQGDDIIVGLKSVLIRLFHGRNVSMELIRVTE
jgi:hypothetical protein